MNTSRKRQAVIFDCDGVMFDSRRANVNYYNHLLAAFGLPPMPPEHEEYVHMHTAAQSVERIFQGTPHLAAAQDYRLRLDYTPFVKDMILDPELRPLLERLRPRFGLAVATNRSNTIEMVLARHGLRRHFDIIVSSLDVEHPKPHPEALHRILAFFDLRADHAYYVGDTWVDQETARAAGVPFVAFRNPELDAPHHASRLTEIDSIVEGGPPQRA